MEITHLEKMKNIENIMKNGPSQLPGIPGIAPPGGANGGGIEECLDWEILEICRRNLLLWTELSKVKGENRGLRKMLTGQQIVIDKEWVVFTKRACRPDDRRLYFSACGIQSKSLF